MFNFILNDDLNGISFGQESDGNWGYIKDGADTVIPFKSGSGNYTITFTDYYVTQNGTGGVIGSGSTGTYHIYINDGVVSTDYSGTSFYRGERVAGWSSVTLQNFTIEES